MIKKQLTIPIYSCKVFVYFDKGLADLRRKLYKKIQFDFDEDDTAIYDGEVLSHDLNYHILFNTDSLDVNTFVHEITHLSIYILKDRGHNFFEETEPLTYLSGYIAGEIEKIMIRNQIEFKKPKIRKKKDGKTELH